MRIDEEHPPTDRIIGIVAQTAIDRAIDHRLRVPDQVDQVPSVLRQVQINNITGSHTELAERIESVGTSRGGGGDRVMTVVIDDRGVRLFVRIIVFSRDIGCRNTSGPAHSQHTQYGKCQPVATKLLAGMGLG